MPESTTKICIKCGQDCSRVPRLRSPQGEYACKSCIASESKIPVTPTDRSGRSRSPCPKCGSARTVGVAACPVCGHAPPIDPGSPKLPKPKKSKRGKPFLCRQCQYDLTGLRDGLCPECGHINSITGRHDWDDEISKEVARSAYLKPLLILGIGLVITFITYAAWGRPVAFVGYLITFPVMVLAAYTLLWLCCLTWLGFTSSGPLMLVQLAGIHGAVGAVASLMSFLPFVGRGGIVVLIACGSVYVYLMSEWMDMESVDARIVAGLMYVAMLALVFVARVNGWM